MSEQEKAPENFSVPELKARGWTRTLIERFLPEADATRPNPRFRSTAPMRLYCQRRVVAIEATEEFLLARRASEFRQNAAKKAVATKAALTLKLARELPVTVHRMSLEKLLKRAVAHYEAHHDYLRSAQCQPWGEADAFRDRICVNYLRHNATPYHDNLDQVSGKVGKTRAYLLLWRRIGQEIKVKYPALAQEFERQYRERFDSRH